MIFVSLLLFLSQSINASYFYINRTLPIQISGTITCIQLSYNNMLLLVSVKQHSSNESRLLLYYLDQKSGFSDYKYEMITYYNDVPGDVNLLVLSRQSNILMLGIKGRSIKFYQLYSNGDLNYAFSIKQWVLSQNQADFSLDTLFIAVAFANNTIQIYLRNLTIIQSKNSINPSLKYDEFYTIDSGNIQISALKISPNSSKLYVAYSNFTICIYDVVNSGYQFHRQIPIENDTITVFHLSDLGKVMVTGSRKGLIRVYVSDSKGNGLYLSQTLNQSSRQIRRIKVSTNDLIMIVTDIDGQTYQYQRVQQIYNWIYNKDKSSRFSQAQVQHNTQQQQIQAFKNKEFIPPILSADDTLIVYPSISHKLIILMVSCCTTHFHCDRCSNNSQCQLCSEYFYLAQNQCSRCPNGCMLCRDEFICHRCAPSNYIDLLKRICIPCNRNFANCRQCDGTRKCTRCVDAYQLIDDQCELVQQLQQSPNNIIRINKTNQLTSIQNQINPISVFVIVCIVFIFLLIIVSVLLFYILKTIKKQKTSINHSSLPSSERNNLIQQ